MDGRVAELQERLEESLKVARSCDVRPVKRLVQSMDGPVERLEPRAHCPLLTTCNHRSRRGIRRLRRENAMLDSPNPVRIPD